MNFSRFSARRSFHPPKSSSTIDVSAIGNENNFRSVRGPSGADLMIEGAVVITWQRTAGLAGQALHMRDVAVREVRRENMEVPFVQGRYKSNALSVGRKSWFKVYSAAHGELMGLLAVEIKAQSSTASFKYDAYTTQCPSGEQSG